MTNQYILRLGLILSTALVTQLGFAVNAFAEEAAKPSGVAASSAIKTTQPKSASKAQTVIGVAPAFFWETTNRRTETKVGGQRFDQDEPVEMSSVGKFNVQAWFLTPVLFDNLELGGGVSWYSEYTLREAEAEEDKEEDHLKYGHVFQLWVQPEYVIPEVFSHLSVLIGVRGGLTALFPGSELSDEFESLRGQGYNVSSLPRLGYFVGPHLGVTWPLADRVLVRSDFSVTFSKLAVKKATAETQGIVSEQSEVLTTTRNQILLGLEFTL